VAADLADRRRLAAPGAGAAPAARAGHGARPGAERSW
jgi:hypothetical protein